MVFTEDAVRDGFPQSLPTFCCLDRSDKIVDNLSFNSLHPTQQCFDSYYSYVYNFCDINAHCSGRHNMGHLVYL